MEIASSPLVRETDCSLPTSSIEAISLSFTNGDGLVAEGVTGISISFNSSDDMNFPSTATASSPSSNS